MTNITKAILTALETGEDTKTVDDIILHKSMNPYTLVSFLKCGVKSDYSQDVAVFVEKVMMHMEERKSDIESMVADNEECWPQGQYNLADELWSEYMNWKFE